METEGLGIIIICWGLSLFGVVFGELSFAFHMQHNTLAYLKAQGNQLLLLTPEENFLSDFISSFSHFAFFLVTVKLSPSSRLIHPKRKKVVDFCFSAVEI